MTDIVSSAISHSDMNFQTTGATQWTITFINNDTRTGAITHLDGNNYKLEIRDKAIYFSASQVVHLNAAGF